jgi:chromatin remodeling complex protein RSC6
VLFVLVVEQWTSFQKTSHDVDGLEVSRTGSSAHTVKIKLLPAQTPERFTISPELDAAIGQYLGPAKAYTKQDIVLAMWEYIKLRNLIKVDDCRVVACDDRMIQVLNCVSLPFTSIIVALKQHLTPVNVIDLEYTLSLSAECDSELLDEHFFDVSVAATSDLDKTRARALKECDELQQDQKKELELLQAQEADILERLHTCTRKKEWMTQFAQDPCSFMADVKKSQLADEQVCAIATAAKRHRPLLTSCYCRFCPPRRSSTNSPFPSHISSLSRGSVRWSGSCSRHAPPPERILQCGQAPVITGETCITDDGAISIARPDVGRWRSFVRCGAGGA